MNLSGSTSSYYDGEKIVKETTLADFINDPSSGNHREKYYTHEVQKLLIKLHLWDEHDLETGHFWNMSIDLSSCSGCGECVVSCHRK